jgi:hypothetical protein
MDTSDLSIEEFLLKKISFSSKLNDYEKVFDEYNNNKYNSSLKIFLTEFKIINEDKCNANEKLKEYVFHKDLSIKSLKNYIKKD